VVTGTGRLRVASAFPDPPFEVPGHPPTGLDVELMTAIAHELGRPYDLHHYEGADFEGIYAELAGDRFDVVASGATVTEHRRTLAHFCTPYLRSGQSLVVDVERNPAIHSTADLRDEIVGVQDGNTSQPVVDRLHADGAVAGVKVYAYDEIGTALGDVGNGTIGAFMKLEPVMRWLTRDRPTLRVVQTAITTELIALAVRLDDAALAADVERAQRSLAASGVLTRLGSRWLSDSDPAATRMITDGQP
jgi:ABC-type amino acid transport substrate-binding protein